LTDGDSEPLDLLAAIFWV